MDISPQACSYRSEVWQLGLPVHFAVIIVEVLVVTCCLSREHLVIQHPRLCSSLKQFLFAVCQKGSQIILTILMMPPYLRVRVCASQQSMLLNHSRLAHLLYCCRWYLFYNIYFTRKSSPHCQYYVLNPVVRGTCMSANPLLLFVCGLTVITLTPICSAAWTSTSVYWPLSTPVESSRRAVASFLISQTAAWRALVGSQWPVYLLSTICMRTAVNLSNLSKYWKSECFGDPLSYWQSPWVCCPQ